MGDSQYVIQGDKGSWLESVGFKEKDTYSGLESGIVDRH
jgi:hypothetical protein